MNKETEKENVMCIQKEILFINPKEKLKLQHFQEINKIEHHYIK